MQLVLLLGYASKQFVCVFAAITHDRLSEEVGTGYCQASFQARLASADAAAGFYNAQAAQSRESAYT
jgi:hypothetical protein